MGEWLIRVGHAAQSFALLGSIYGAAMGVIAVQSRSEALLRSTFRAVRAVLAMVALSAAGLWCAFLTDRFDLEYVALYSSRALPLGYKLAAFWGGQKGSLALWGLILAVITAVVVRPRRGADAADRLLLGGAASVLMAILSFFLILENFSTDPFERIPGAAPADGNGLNPLLQHPAMAFHPPALYLGFVGMSVPFAYMVAALWLGRRDDQWIRLSRKATLVSWASLFVGNLLGMGWAYMELGWGGYWAWDPVENAACMPLLTGTAFLHSVMIQERRGMLKMWNAWLVAITFVLTIFGTFLTRSGVVSSVHSFGASTLGTYFLVFLAICIGFSVLTIVKHRELLRSEHRLDSIWSREAAFIVNNIILVGAAFSILWGTTYPIVSEALTDVKASVGAPFFNRVNVPIAIALLALTGVGPLVAWRRASLDQLRRSFLAPLLVGIAVTATLAVLGVTKAYALLVFALSAFVMATIVEEFWRGVRARRATHQEGAAAALAMLVLRNPRRYGGYLVHVGVLLFIVGIAASSAYKVESEALLTPGGEMHAGRYRLRLDDVAAVSSDRASGIAVTLTAFLGEREVARLAPERLVYKTGVRQDEQPTTNVAIRSTLRDDLYVVPAAYFPETRTVHVRAYVNPMVAWIWTGGSLVLVGVAVALIPMRRLPRSDTVPRPVVVRDAAAISSAPVGVAS